MLTTVTVTLRLPADDAAELIDEGQAAHRRLTRLADLIRAGEVDLVTAVVVPTTAVLSATWTAQEYRLLFALQTARGQLVPYAALTRALWGHATPEAADIATIRAHVKHIRAKLRALALDPWLIEGTVRRGYRLAGDFDLLPPDAPRLAPLRPTKARA